MKRNRQIEDKDWELIAKTIYNENPENVSELKTFEDNNLLGSDIERRQVLNTAKQVDLYFNLKNYSSEHAWGKVESRIHNPISTSRTKLHKLFTNPIYRVAAAVLVAAILLFSGYEIYYSPSASSKIMEITSTDQIISTFTLPDGTLVSLNKNTKVYYPKRFGNEAREVSIEGEAFFEVKQNKNKPFIINAGNAQIKVLGTSFNVNAYPESKLVEIIVETGRVQVFNKTTETIQTDKLILTSGDKGTLIYSSNSLLKTTNQDPNFLAWKTHNLIFKVTSLGEVIHNLEKVYNVKIRLADPKLNELLLTAQFNNYSLGFILEVIETTFQVKAQSVNGQYIIKAGS